MRSCQAVRMLLVAAARRIAQGLLRLRIVVALVIDLGNADAQGRGGAGIDAGPQGFPIGVLRPAQRAVIDQGAGQHLVILGRQRKIVRLGGELHQQHDRLEIVPGCGKKAGIADAGVAIAARAVGSVPHRGAIHRAPQALQVPSGGNIARCRQLLMQLQDWRRKPVLALRHQHQFGGRIGNLAAVVQGQGPRLGVAGVLHKHFGVDLMGTGFQAHSPQPVHAVPEQGLRFIGIEAAVDRRGAIERKAHANDEGTGIAGAQINRRPGAVAVQDAAFQAERLRPQLQGFLLDRVGPGLRLDTRFVGKCRAAAQPQQ